jgi:RNA polymerase sigma-70 factor (ECF subfamily)
MSAFAQTSLESLYREHGSWLLNWLTSRSNCRTRASDLAQDTFCRLAEQRDLRLYSHPRRYLVTVARRLLIDDTRRKASERSFLEAFALHMGDTAAPGPDRIAEAVEALTALSILLEGLPDRTRRAFLMSRMDGMTYAEIGTELGVSTSMVKQYVAQAFAHCYVIAHASAD